MSKKIIVGSKNQIKVEAVREILEDYPHLAGSIISEEDTSSGVDDQPKSIEETVTGAINRAKNCFKDCDFSIGLESGLIIVPYTKGGYMDVCICAIYDGKDIHLGMSSGWEFPDPKIMDSIVKEGLNMSEAVNKAGITNDVNIGSKEGAIGILTKGRVTRKEYTKQALRTALIHLEIHDFKNIQN